MIIKKPESFAAGRNFSTGDQIGKEFGDFHFKELEEKISILGKSIDDLRAKIVKIRNGELEGEEELVMSELANHLESMKRLCDEQRALRKKFGI